MIGSPALRGAAHDNARGLPRPIDRANQWELLLPDPSLFRYSPLRPGSVGFLSLCPRISLSEALGLLPWKWPARAIAPWPAPNSPVRCAGPGCTPELRIWLRLRADFIAALLGHEGASFRHRGADVIRPGRTGHQQRRKRCDDERADYHGNTSPRCVKLPFGPSSPISAIATLLLAPSNTPIWPSPPFMSVCT